MKKRILAMLAMLVILALVITTFAPALSAEEAGDTVTTGEAAEPYEGPGGLDFYSVTIHYESPILVDYVKNTANKKDANFYFEYEGEESAMSDVFVWRAGTTKDNAYFTDKEAKKADGNFYQLRSTQLGLSAVAQYSKVPYNYAYITHIQDGAILKSKGSISLFGITAPYDEGDPYVNKNPNVSYNSDGYALAQETDEEGNNLRIDINGYLLPQDDIWRDSKGRRVEMFYQKARIVLSGFDSKGKAVYAVEYYDEYEPFPFEMRYAEDGKIRDIFDVQALQYITKEEVDEFIAANPDASGSNPKYLYLNKVTFDPDEIKELTSSSNKKNYVFPPKNTTPRELLAIDRVIPASQLPEGAEEGTKFTDEEYFDKTRVFTNDNIERTGNQEQRIVVISTPAIGSPVLNVKIKSITVEIDAVGDKLYDNPEEDPQNKNIITLSLDDTEYNCLRKKQALDEHRLTEADYNKFSSMIVGSVHSKTTSTEPNFDSNKTEQYKATVQSLTFEIDEETMAKLPLDATLFLNFHIETHQPEAAFDISKCNTEKGGKTKLTPVNADEWPMPNVIPEDNKADENAGGLPTWALIAIIAGGVVVVGAIVAVIIASAAKKKKSA
ncbi:MAG: hypothetical protein J6V14_06295 [Clostridia bacterium]|nr:hypothetical protein [Clostridia bacterium]